MIYKLMINVSAILSDVNALNRCIGKNLLILTDWNFFIVFHSVNLATLSKNRVMFEPSTYNHKGRPQAPMPTGFDEPGVNLTLLRTNLPRTLHLNHQRELYQKEGSS